MSYRLHCIYQSSEEFLICTDSHCLCNELLLFLLATMLWRGEKLARAVKKQARELPSHNHLRRVHQLPIELIPRTMLEEMKHHFQETPQINQERPQDLLLVEARLLLQKMKRYFQIQ